MKTLKTRQSIAIDLPAGEIFAYMSELDNLVDWSGAMISVRKSSPGEIHVGATLRSTIRFLGRWMDITFEVVECEPGRCLTIKSLSGVAPCLFCYLFEPVEDNRTIISLETAIQLSGGILGLTESAVAKVTRRQLEHDLLTLKDVLEAGTALSRNAL